MKEKINIVCCLDDNFAQHCGVVMASVLENTKSEIIFHIVSDGLKKENEDKLTSIANQYKVLLVFHTIDSSVLEACYIHPNSHVSLATYFRILLPKLLPDIDKVIYLDCDLVVRHDLMELWQFDISDKAIAAVPDGTHCDIRNYNRLKYNPSLNYINAGVLLINLKYWREHGVIKRIMNYIERYPDRLMWWDQDAINGTLIKDTVLLPIKFNMQDQYFYRDPMFEQKTIDEIENVIEDPTIIHYTTSTKAWHKYAQHPYKSEYFKYLKLTPWKKYKPKFKKSLSIGTKIRMIITNKLLGKSINSYRETD